MVEIISNTQDGASYEVPLFKIAAALPRKFNDSSETLPMGFDRHLQQNGHKGQKFLAVKAVSMGGMDAYAMLTLPAIVQEGYDALPAAERAEGVRFFSVLAMQYVDEQGVGRQYNSFFDANSAHDEQTKRGIQDFIAANQKRIFKAGFWMVAASLAQELALPAERMSNHIQATHKRMFDRTRYRSALYPDADGKAARVLRRVIDPADSADKLLEPLARVYDLQVQREWGTGGAEAIILTEHGFQRMEREEMPGRHKGG